MNHTGQSQRRQTIHWTNQNYTIIRNSHDVHYSCPRFCYPVYWMCIEYKDCVYNCWEINVWSLLLTFKCCKMLLEDGEARRWRNKRELVDARPSNAARSCKYPTPPCALAKIVTRDDRARLVSSNRECFAHYKHRFLTFSTNILCPCMYTPWDS